MDTGMDTGMDKDMDTGNELSRIGDTIGDIISNFLFDDNYKIDDTLEWLELSQVYIMRYRRIIGIVILVILLGIMYYCNWKDDNEKEFRLQTGGGSSIIAAAKAAKQTAKKVNGETFFKDTFTTKQVSKLKNVAGNALEKSKLGQFTTGKLDDIKDMRSAGMTKFGVAKQLTGQAGQFAADKFKENANWLYEIQFAIAISIAICMIVVPSIAFFALGLICYFLLRKKISSIKAF